MGVTNSESGGGGGESMSGWNEKNMKENDYADGMKQEVDSKDTVMHIEMNDL